MGLNRAPEDRKTKNLIPLVAEKELIGSSLPGWRQHVTNQEAQLETMEQEGLWEPCDYVSV